MKVGIQWDVTRLSVPDEGITIDRISQRMLFALWKESRDAGDDPSKTWFLTTSRLADEVDLNHNQQARYRLTGDLADAGFVKKVSEAPTRGPEPVDCWGITERGRDWVDNNIEQITPPQTLAEVCEQIRPIADRLDNIESQLDSIRGSAGWNKRRLEGMEERFEEIEEDHPKMWEYIVSNHEDLGTHKEALEHLYQQLDVDPPEETG
jgi:archaellum component FlaC